MLRTWIITFISKLYWRSRREESNWLQFKRNFFSTGKFWDFTLCNVETEVTSDSSFSSPRFATPLGLTALGYRFFASSPVRDPVTKSPSADALKYNPISPIGHSYGNSFKSCGRSMPTVAERLVLTASNNTNNNNNNNTNSSLSMPNSGRSTPVQSSSGRSTPTNLILSPTKSTMSNEELFAAIHKSKKRLNIKDDNENLSPYGSTNSLAKTATPTKRSSWTSESQRFATVCLCDLREILGTRDLFD